MRRFFSAIVCRNGDILAAPEYTDSHEDLILHFGLEEAPDPRLNQWIRVEFVPAESQPIAEPESYRLWVYEVCRPVWFDGDLEERVVSAMRARISRMIIRDSRKLVLGGCWIIDGGTVGRMAHARVVAMLGGEIDVLDSSRIRTMRGSAHIAKMRGSSRVGEMRGSSQIDAMNDSSRINIMWESAQIDEMGGSSCIGEMYGSAQINEMRGSSCIGEMYGSARINMMGGSSQIGEMGSLARITRMRDSAQITKMRGSARIDTMGDSARIAEMWDSSRIDEISDAAQIGDMRDSSRIGTMRGSAHIDRMWGGSSRINEDMR